LEGPSKEATEEGERLPEAALGGTPQVSYQRSRSSTAIEDPALLLDVQQLLEEMTQPEEIPETVAVYYHTACKGFTGRATAAIMILEHAGQAYELLDCDAIDPSSPVFAPPMIQVGGETISQAPCIHKTLGEMTGLAPKGYVKQHRAFQVALDAADILSESLAGKFEGDEGEARAGKWLDHVEALVCAGILDFKRPGYHDFAMLMALLQMSQLLSTLDSSQKGLWPLRHRPLRIWLRQMKLTKGYVAYEAMDLPFLPGDEGASKLEIGEPVPLPAKKRGCKAPSCMLM